METPTITALIADGKCLVERCADVDGLFDTDVQQGRSCYYVLEMEMGSWKTRVLNFKIHSKKEEWGAFKNDLKDQESQLTRAFGQLQETFRQKGLGAVPHSAQERRIDPRLEVWLRGSLATRESET